MSDLPGFRWLPGMLADDGHRVVRVVNGVAVRAGGVIGAVVGPDWTDPLTALGLLVLVRDVHPDAVVYTLPPSPLSIHPKWAVRKQTQTDPNSVLDETIGEGPTETEALKAALAAPAPRKP